MVQAMKMRYGQSEVEQLELELLCRELQEKLIQVYSQFGLLAGCQMVVMDANRPDAKKAEANRTEADREDQTNGHHDTDLEGH